MTIWATAGTEVFAERRGFSPPITAASRASRCWPEGSSEVEFTVILGPEWAEASEEPEGKEKEAERWGFSPPIIAASRASRWWPVGS
jgi:hypothetical protein